MYGLLRQCTLTPFTSYYTERDTGGPVLWLTKSVTKTVTRAAFLWLTMQVADTKQGTRRTQAAYTQHGVWQGQDQAHSVSTHCNVVRRVHQRKMYQQ